MKPAMRERKCRHDKRRYWTRLATQCDADRAAFLVCDDCGATLPLGPARMSPEVEVEVRAAELAARVADGEHIYHATEENRSDWYGWAQHVAIHHHGDDEATVLDNELAGYLARCIVESEEP